MPTSATGISTNAPRGCALERGFSLLELLVVVAIIGILVGAVVLSIDIVGPDREAEQEAQRVKSLVDLLHEEALMQSRDYGLLFTGTGYRFYVYDYQKLKWVEPIDDRLLREHLLQKPLALALALDDRDVDLPDTFEDLDERKDPEPQVMVLSSGELTPFALDVYRDRSGGRYHLSAELDGTLKLSQDGYYHSR